MCSLVCFSKERSRMTVGRDDYIVRCKPTTGNPSFGLFCLGGCGKVLLSQIIRCGEDNGLV